MKQDEITKLYKDRINNLLDKLSGRRPFSRSTVDGCFVGTLSVIESLYGSNSHQAKALFESKKAYTKTSYSDAYELESLNDSIQGTLLNIREELESGLIRNIATETAGEIIGDLVALAKAELKAGFSNVTAVLASAALEDALKRKAEELGITVQKKTLDSIINSLKKQSFFKGAQVPIVSSYVKLRNAAMHAEWGKIQTADISSLIGFLEPFLMEHFS